MDRTASDLPSPPDAESQDSVAWRELERQFAFFDLKAKRNHRLHVLLRGLVLVAGAATPLVALTTDRQIWTAVLGAVVVMAEGISQLAQAHDHWVRYRRAAELLRAEALTFCTSTGPYASLDVAEQLDVLAERLTNISTLEGSEWFETAQTARRTD